MTAPLSKDEVSVVLIGSFNPTIYHPSWLALNNLISKEQADNAAITRIVYAEVTQFSAAYMSFEVLPQRLTVRCEGIYGDAVRDLVLKTFGEILPHTPIRQMGINRSYEVKCTSESARSQLGMQLAPFVPWGAWGEEIAKDMNGPIHGGMTRIQMLQLPRPDGLDGHIQADVHPNLTDRTGVFLDINNHFNVAAPDDLTGTARALDILTSSWSSCMNQAQSILEGILETVDGL